MLSHWEMQVWLEEVAGPPLPQTFCDPPRVPLLWQPQGNRHLHRRAQNASGPSQCRSGLVAVDTCMNEAETDAAVGSVRQQRRWLGGRVSVGPSQDQLRPSCPTVSARCHPQHRPAVTRAVLQDFFFYSLVYDPQQKTLLADKGEIRVGNRYQADITDLLKEGGAAWGGSGDRVTASPGPWSTFPVGSVFGF